jgi:serine kinase of HPr protein (carbohydrate metabolism regulator)
MAATLQLHATTVEIGGAGVLLRGAPGSGKSDLALRLIGEGAQLVADDRTDIEAVGGRLIARAPETIAGLLEVRGLGIVEIGAAPQTVLALAVDLATPADIERLPGPAETDILGIRLPLLTLAAFEAGATAKLRLALDVVRGDMMLRHGPED